MNYVDEVIRVLQMSNVAAVFGLEPSSAVFLIIGMLILGIVCLTFHFVIVSHDEQWLKLSYLEKFVLSIIVGFSCILATSFILLVAETLIDFKFFRQSLSQFYYVGPFIYFYLFSKFAAKRKNSFSFIKSIVIDSFIIVSVCTYVFIILLGIFFLRRFDLSAILLIGLLLVWFSFYPGWKKDKIMVFLHSLKF